MIETKPRIKRGNRGQLFRATWLSSARCCETFRRTTERVECSNQAKSSEVSIKTRSTPASLSIQARTPSTQLQNGLLSAWNFFHGA